MSISGTKPLQEPRVFDDTDSADPITSADFTLSRDAWGQLVLTGTDATCHMAVAPTPLFPISYPDKWVSLRDSDGIEVACIEDPDAMPPGTRKVLEEELARREFVPIIERVVQISGSTEPTEWVVETDRGQTTFVLKSQDDVRRIDENQIVIVDAHGTRYHIPDLGAVDAKSRRLVEWYV